MEASAPLFRAVSKWGRENEFDYMRTYETVWVVSLVPPAGREELCPCRCKYGVCATNHKEYISCYLYDIHMKNLPSSVFHFFLFIAFMNLAGPQVLWLNSVHPVHTEKYHQLTIQVIGVWLDLTRCLDKNPLSTHYFLFKIVYYSAYK